MKVANKKPETVKSPVRISDNVYHLYYAKPIMLGVINRVGQYWFTEDGMRFVSSRDALDYLAKVREMVEQELRVDVLYRERIATQRRQGAEKRLTMQLPERQKPGPKPGSVRVRKAVIAPQEQSLKDKTEELHRLLLGLGYVPASENGNK